jgi:hypothetical protein
MVVIDSSVLIRCRKSLTVVLNLHESVIHLSLLDNKQDDSLYSLNFLTADSFFDLVGSCANDLLNDGN